MIFIHKWDRENPVKIHMRVSKYSDGNNEISYEYGIKCLKCHEILSYCEGQIYPSFGCFGKKYRKHNDDYNKKSYFAV